MAYNGTDANGNGAVAAALADPTRRIILERLGRSPCAVGALADELPVSRPAVSQHLAQLDAAGLVRSEARGTRRIYSLRPEGIATLRDWLDSLWEDAMNGYAAEAKRLEENDR